MRPELVQVLNNGEFSSVVQPTRLSTTVYKSFDEINAIVFSLEK